MADFLKDFKTHSDYINYITGGGGIGQFWPNVSYCEDNNEVHYNPDPRLVCRYQPTVGIKIYIEDFPANIAEDDYDGDMASFKEDYMGNNIIKCNEYTYTDETFKYSGEEYYLWEYTGTDDSGTVKYILTDTLDFTGKSLEDDINNDFCPFAYILGSDYEVTYTNEDHDDYWLVGVRDASQSIIKLYNNSQLAVNLFERVEIDGISVSPQSLDENQGRYIFYGAGTHIVKYSLIGPTSIGDNVFQGCTFLTSVTIPNSVTSIGDGAFYGCNLLTSVTIPNSVTIIDDGAFYGCTSLTTVTIPNGVTSIGELTFYNCRALANVTIGNSVTSIGYSAFNSCTALTSVTIEAAIPPMLGVSVFYNTKNCPIYVPVQSVNTYKAATNWSSYASRIQAIP